ncbi:MAG: hypothetical protein KJ630_20895 [Proteobacteria bacterium]|nr:hypothetical protein [Pseudomonadota bacterium]
MQNASKLTLCIDVADNAIGQEILCDCVLALEKIADEVGCILSVILTGSFSRGEGSVLFMPSGEALILGDIEFIVVTKLGSDLGHIAMLLKSAAKKVELSLKEKSISCLIDFSPVARSFLKRAKPSIFIYELLLNGKVVYGDSNILGELPVFTASHIPKCDAFYLLCNRIVEQLSYFKKMSLSDLTDVDMYYPLVKLYMDMAGSFLIITDRYEPSYSLRYERFAQMNASDCFVDGDLFSVFVKRLEEMTKFKLHPNNANAILSDISPETVRNMFCDSIEFARHLWLWEIRQLTNNKNIYDLGVSFQTIMKVFPVKAKVRGWLKFIKIASDISEPLSFKKIFRLYFVGPPQILIYCAAAELYFSLQRGEECDVKKVMHFLPTQATAANQQEAISAVVDAWNKFIRSV